MMLFADEFIESPPIFDDYDWHIENYLQPAARRTDVTSPLLGGIESAFASGKKVLEIACGETVGLYQFALEYPETTFVGVDSGFDQRKKIDLSKVGIQLTKDNWFFLSSLDNLSMDTIITYNGPFQWAVPVGYDLNVTKQDTTLMLKAITRVAKRGAQLRFNHFHYHREYIHKLLSQYGWNTHFFGKSAVAEHVGIKKMEAMKGSGA